MSLLLSADDSLTSNFIWLGVASWKRVNAFVKLSAVPYPKSSATSSTFLQIKLRNTGDLSTIAWQKFFMQVAFHIINSFVQRANPVHNTPPAGQTKRKYK